MTEIPPAWLWVSGICFGMSILTNLVLIGVAIAAWGKIGPLISDLRGQIKQLSDKVNAITSTAKSTVDIVHSRTEKILGGAEEASSTVSQKIGAASTALTTVFVAMRIVGFVRGLAKEERAAGQKRIK